MQGEFGSLKSFFRIHFYLPEILPTSEDGNEEEAEPIVIQSLKAHLQVAVDKGDWQNAELLMPMQPHGRVHFGGDEHEMQAMFKYHKSLLELQSKNQKGGPADDDDNDEDGGAKDKKKPKGKKKGDDEKPE